MKCISSRSAKYLGLFTVLFFLATMQYCWANPVPMGQAMLDEFGKPVLAAEIVIVILEMFLLRWLLALDWPKALGISFIANLISLAGGAILFDELEYRVTTTVELFLGLNLTVELIEIIIILLTLLAFAILIEGLTIKIFNWRLGLKKILKASLVANAISYPLFIVFMVLLIG